MQNKIIQFEKKVIPDDLITVKQCAEKCGCTPQYLYKLRDLQKLKMYPRGYMKVSEREALQAMER